ncbi:MAG: alpha/beta hydrolase [Planctomycetota bacterium]
MRNRKYWLEPKVQIVLICCFLISGCGRSSIQSENDGELRLQADFDSGKSLALDGGAYRLYGRQFQSKETSNEPVLAVVLHGDAPGIRPDYQNVMARRIAEATDNVVAIALLRPGYEDSDGNVSQGVRGDSVGDNWNATNTDSIAEAVMSLVGSTKARKVVLVGHSGGSAIAANLAARHPTLVNAIVLVSFPGDVNRWRRHMYAKTGFESFKGNIDSLSVLEGIENISNSLSITTVVGDEDDVTPAELGVHYAEQLSQNGKEVKIVSLPGKGHDILLEPEVLQVVAELVATKRGDSVEPQREP